MAWLFDWLDHARRAMTSAEHWNQLGPSIVAGVISALVAVYVARYTVSASVQKQERIAKRRAEDDALRRVSETLYELLIGMDEVAARDVTIDLRRTSLMRRSYIWCWSSKRP